MLSPCHAMPCPALPCPAQPCSPPALPSPALLGVWWLMGWFWVMWGAIWVKLKFWRLWKTRVYAYVFQEVRFLWIEVLVVGSPALFYDGLFWWKSWFLKFQCFKNQWYMLIFLTFEILFGILILAICAWKCPWSVSGFCFFLEIWIFENFKVWKIVVYTSVFKGFDFVENAYSNKNECFWGWAGPLPNGVFHGVFFHFLYESWFW